jgi:hypothetical protein
MGAIPTVEVALLPGGSYLIVNAADFDPAKHVLWADRKAKAVKAEDDEPEVTVPTTKAEVTRDRLEPLNMDQLREVATNLFGAKLGRSKADGVEQLLELAAQ